VSSLNIEATGQKKMLGKGVQKTSSTPSSVIQGDQIFRFLFLFCFLVDRE
jgi:hypothetical protein